MCVSPLRAFETDFKTKNGCVKYIIKKKPVDYVYYKGGKYDKFTEVPCGHCVECKVAYSSQWASRCMLEASYHEHNYFITLTYDDAHNDGSLHREDFTLFIKRLRKHFSQFTLKYFASGEYGTSTARPHYHFILFGAPELLLSIYKKNFNGDLLYNCEELSSLWNKGFVVVGDVNQTTCSYVARYCIKKQFGSKNDYYSLGLEPEFITMSNRPGIGRRYFDDNGSSIYEFEKIYTDFGMYDIPRYFDKLLQKSNEKLYNEIKEKRKLSMMWKKGILFNKPLFNYQAYLASKKDFLERKLEIFKKENIN